jgi:hypothetical protein
LSNGIGWYGYPFFPHLYSTNCCSHKVTPCATMVHARKSAHAIIVQKLLRLLVL